MALIQTVNASDLYHLACKMGRDKNFGYNGWRAIGDYLENLSNDLGENIEIDIIGLCCEYSMAESVEEAWEHVAQFGDIEDDEWQNLDDDEKLAAVREYLQENTSLVVCEDDLIIWQAF